LLIRKGGKKEKKIHSNAQISRSESCEKIEDTDPYAESHKNNTFLELKRKEPPAGTLKKNILPLKDRGGRNWGRLNLQSQ